MKRVDRGRPGGFKDQDERRSHRDRQGEDAAGEKIDRWNIDGASFSLKAPYQ
jgi:hypothetical protein